MQNHELATRKITFVMFDKEEAWREHKWKLFGVLPIWCVKEALPKFMR